MTRPTLRMLILSGTLLLAGCADRRSTALVDLTRGLETPWRAVPEGPIAVREGPAELAAWWTHLDAKVLPALADQLLTSNLSLAEARQRILAAGARRGVAESQRLPQLDLNASYTRSSTGSDALPSQGPRPGREADAFLFGAAAGWELDLWGRIGRLVDAAEAERQASIDDYRGAAVSLLAELALAFNEARTLGARLAVLDHNIALQKETLQLVQTRQRAGTGSELDVAQARRELRQSESRVPELKRGIAAAENRLAVLLGKRPRDGLLPPGEPPVLPENLTLGIPADLLRRRADIRAAERRYDAALARIDATEREHLPRVSLAGTINLSAEELGTFVSGNALTYSVGPRITVPILEGGRISSQTRERTAVAEELRLALERVVLTAVQEVETAAIGVIRSREQLASLQQSAEAARKTVSLARELNESGLRDVLQVLDAERQLVAVEDQLWQARQAAVAEVIRLYRALGGGWETIPLPGAPAPAGEDPSREVGS